MFIVPGCPPAAVVRRSLPVALSQHKVQDHASLPTISEEVTSPTSLTSVTLPTSPLSSSSSPSSPSCSTLTPTVATPATTSCADPSDYQDFLSKLGILSLSLNPTDTRFSITKLDSPDDTLISGSASLTASSVTSPVESPPNSLPQPVVVDGRTNNSSQTNDESAVVAASTAADNPGISDAPGEYGPRDRCSLSGVHIKCVGRCLGQFLLADWLCCCCCRCRCCPRLSRSVFAAAFFL